MIEHFDVIQRTDQWFLLRMGKFTGTDFQTIANGRAATKETLIYKKAAEILTGHRNENGFFNEQMERGVETEEEARQVFEFETGLTVKECGFVEKDQYSGISPDGLIGDDAGIEIKCKDDHTHLKCLLSGDNSYKWQLQGSLYVTGRKKWYFVSYNRFFPPEKMLYVEEVYPDEESFEKIRIGLREAIQQLETILKKAA
ncbi:MAG: YqaJ-like viral recombinase [Deltaproteobacteria bacterium]|jgi:hypothetical protein|nr:YqaJ-like viral recombinase [Deltaproteobacteria bacterium]